MGLLRRLESSIIEKGFEMDLFDGSDGSSKEEEEETRILPPLLFGKLVGYMHKHRDTMMDDGHFRQKEFVQVQAMCDHLREQNVEEGKLICTHI